jgi:hypothetical protein
MRSLALPLAALGLAGCAAYPENPAGPAPEGAGADACGLVDYGWLRGSNIAAVTLPADLNDRIIRPGMAVTKDYRPDRLNIVVDENGTVTDLYCG